MIDDVRNFLFGPPGSGGFDLASLNIQRGRDHGLPSYNQARIDYGLAPVGTFAEITSDSEVLARLDATYRSIDEVDIWLGGLCEDPVPGAIVGPLFHAILTDQFERLRDGDRFFYRLMPAELIEFVEAQTLATVIRNNTTIGREIQDDVMVAGSRLLVRRL